MRRRALLVSLLLLVCALAVAIGAGIGRRSGSGVLAQSSAIAVVGHIAPDFTLKTSTGRAVTLSSLRGRPVVLNFFASWCTDCRLEAPALNALHRRLGAGVAFYGVNATEVDSVSAAAAFARQYRLSYPYLLDMNGDVAQEYGIIGLPVTFFLNADGRIIKRVEGPVTLASGLADIHAAKGA